MTDLLRERLEALREEVRGDCLSGADLRRAVSATALAAAVREAAARLLEPRPRIVLNATGVVVHTNLGRSPWSAAAAAELGRLSRGYMDLEYDRASGGRGSRLSHLQPLMARLFPGSDFVAVNNNAAAVMLCLRALARTKEVLISRGELVEIGGSFRVPDILAASGARLREVGTTNRTRVADYAAACGKRAGLILKVHTSNFSIVGFSEAAPIDKLARLARKNGLPLVVDWGSGDLVDLEGLGIEDELPIARVLEAGADLVTFSCDKLLGGPQAGLVVGDPARIGRLRKDPLARVCRLDRISVAALHRTLAAYVRGQAFEEIPTLRMLALDATSIGRRAERVRREIDRRTGLKWTRVVKGESRTGGGSSPGGRLPTRLLAVEDPGGDAGAIEKRLREGEPPLIGRMHDGRLLLDLRTVPEDEDAVLGRLVAEAIAAGR